MTDTEEDLLQLSGLQHFAFCRRQWALAYIEMQWAENLRTVEIAEGCTHLGYRAFGNCKALEKITIPATVRQIGGECFLNCEKLTIHGKAGSYAQQYARGHGIPFCAE